MTQQFFNRTARLLIGKQTAPGGLPVGIEIKTPLRITFELTKTEFSIMNEGKITVDNLSPTTKNAIREGMWLVLEAGYVDAGGLQTIFHGEIVNVSHNEKKPEMLTTITVQDGHTAIKQSTVSLSFKKGANVSNIIKAAMAGLKLPVNSTFSYVQLPTTQLRTSFAFVGPAATLLDILCADHGLLWSVQNGSIKIYNVGKTDNLPPLKTVLIGSPRRLFKNQLSESLNDFNGYEIDCLLAPNAEPGNGLTLQSKEITKPVNLQIVEVNHKGDFYGDHWMTTIKAKDL